MKAEQAKQLAETGITSLAAALEQGRSSTLTNYLTMLSRFRDYSFSESDLLAKNREEDILRQAIARDLAVLVVRRLASL